MNTPILHPTPACSIPELGAAAAALLDEARELAAELDAFRLLAHVAIGEVARQAAVIRSQALTIAKLRSEARRYTRRQVDDRRAA